MRIIYVFDDEGMCKTGAVFVQRAYTLALQNFGFDVRLINAEQIKDDTTLFQPNVEMLVVGSGISFTKVKSVLGDKGERNIKNFIHQGGKYNGICLGSIGALNGIEYHAHDGLKTNTGFALFNMTARGSLAVAPLYDGTSKCATIITPHHLQRNITFPALYWGGNGMDREQIESIGATPLTKINLPNGEEKVMSARMDIGSNGGSAFISGYHFEAYTRKMLWEWVIQFAEKGTDTKRLEQEILAHPEKAYLMGLACALDDMKLVEGHSFTHSIWPEGVQPTIDTKKPAAFKQQAFPLTI